VFVRLASSAKIGETNEIINIRDKSTPTFFISYLDKGSL
jgi:hypothetical protein